MLRADAKGTQKRVRRGDPSRPLPTSTTKEEERLRNLVKICFSLCTLSEVHYVFFFFPLSHHWSSNSPFFHQARLRERKVYSKKKILFLSNLSTFYKLHSLLYTLKTYLDSLY